MGFVTPTTLRPAILDELTRPAERGGSPPGVIEDSGSAVIVYSPVIAPDIFYTSVTAAKAIVEKVWWAWRAGAE